MGIPLYGQNKDGDNLEQFANALHGSKPWHPSSIDDGNEKGLEIHEEGAPFGE